MKIKFKVNFGDMKTSNTRTYEDLPGSVSVVYDVAKKTLKVNYPPADFTITFKERSFNIQSRATYDDGNPWGCDWGGDGYVSLYKVRALKEAFTKAGVCFKVKTDKGDEHSISGTVSIAEYKEKFRQLFEELLLKSVEMKRRDDLSFIKLRMEYIRNLLSFGNVEEVMANPTRVIGTDNIRGGESDVTALYAYEDSLRERKFSYWKYKRELLEKFDLEILRESLSEIDTLLRTFEMSLSSRERQAAVSHATKLKAKVNRFFDHVATFEMPTPEVTPKMPASFFQTLFDLIDHHMVFPSLHGSDSAASHDETFAGTNALSQPKQDTSGSATLLLSVLSAQSASRYSGGCDSSTVQSASNEDNFSGERNGYPAHNGV